MIQQLSADRVAIQHREECIHGEPGGIVFLPCLGM
jgi:hypothetical protein